MGVMKGKGKMFFKNGDVFDGEFSKDEIEGKGQMIYADDRIYTGNWKNGMKNGYGEETSNK